MNMTSCKRHGRRKRRSRKRRRAPLPRNVVASPAPRAPPWLHPLHWELHCAETHWSAQLPCCTLANRWFLHNAVHNCTGAQCSAHPLAKLPVCSWLQFTSGRASYDLVVHNTRRCSFMINSKTNSWKPRAAQPRDQYLTKLLFFHLGKPLNTNSAVFLTLLKGFGQTHVQKFCCKYSIILKGSLAT